MSPSPATPAGSDSGGSTLPFVPGIVAAVVIVIVIAFVLLARQPRHARRHSRAV